MDSQESFKNIVVQVIGEMSNKAAPHRKFVQTFVLAEQPNGYFVLNDIFRYINEEEEEEEEVENAAIPEPQDPAPVEAEMAKTLTSSDDSSAQQQDAELIDKKLEEKILDDETDESVVPTVVSNGEGSSTVEGEDETIDDTTQPVPVEEDEAHKVVSLSDETETAPQEKPKDPDPTPIASPPKQAEAEPSDVSMPASAPKPAAPKTWANLVAARVPSTSASSTASASSVSPAPPQTKAQSSTATTVVAAPPPPSIDDASTQALPSPGGWQTAGQDGGKRQARQQSNSVSGGTSERGNILGYVKNVTERVDAVELKATLNQYGKLEYFDVSRQKVSHTIQTCKAATC